MLACLRDAAGNVATAQDTTVRDTTAPTVTTVACAGCSQDAGTTFSRSSSVTLAVTSDEQGSGLASARVAVDAGVEAPLALVNGAIVVNGLVEGSRTLRVKLVDGAGNTSALSKDIVVVVDQTAPALAALLINGTNAADNATSSRTVQLGITGASADTAHMAIADGNGTTPPLSNCATAVYTPFTAELSRTLLAVDGDKAVSVCLRDRAGNTSAAATTSIVRLDTIPVSLPAVPVSIQDGDGFLQTETTITVRLSWTTNGDARQAKVQEGFVDCASPTGYLALPVGANTFDVVGVGVSSGDGQKLIGVCCKDAANNVITAQDATVRDGTAPVVTALSCPGCTADNGTVFSRSTSATLLVSAIEQGSGLSDARVTRNGTNLTLALAGSSVTVPALNQGANSVVVKLADVAGNITGNGNDQTITLTVDTIPPNVAAGGLRLNGTSAGGATNNAVVTATIVGAPADAAAMSLVEAGSAPSCANATYGPLALASSLQLSSGEGEKSVFVCLRDRAGNTQTTATLARITLDTTPPSLPAASVDIQDGGTGFLTSVQGGVDVRLSWNVAGDVVAFKLGENAVDCASEPYERPVGIATVTTLLREDFPLSPVDGQKRVVVCFKDAAGNISVGQDTTTLDLVGPNGAIVINDGAVFTTDPSEDITVTARMATDTARFAIAETVNAACAVATLNCETATYETFVGAVVEGQLQADKSLNLSGGAAAAQGPKCVEACFEDAAGNRTETASLAAITFDTQAPTVGAGSVTLVGTPAGAVSRTNLITVAVASAPADTTAMRVGEDNTFAGGAQAFTTFTSAPQPLLLSAGDGVKTVFVQLRDEAGNVGSATQRTITVDATPPENVSVTVNAGAQFATSVNVTLALAATGAVQMQIATDGVPDTEPFVAFSTSAAAVLPAGDGPKLVVVRFRDAAGNTATASDGIELDTGAPVGGAVTINDGAIVTNNTTVTLTTNPPTDAATMSIGGGPFVPVSNAALTQISAGDCTPGVLCKTVSVVFRDAAGNSGSAVVDTISLDTVPPSSVAVTLTSTNANDTPGFMTGLTADASFSFATGAGNATSVKHGEGAVDCATPAGYVALGALSPLVAEDIQLSAIDGQKSYVACFRDAAGNVSSAVTAITMDRTRPVGFVTINGGAATTTTTAVTMNVTPASDDVRRVAFVNAASPPVCGSITAGSFQDIQFSMPHTLTSGDATKTVFACFRDEAGNVSQAATAASIRLDATPPSVAFTVIGNATADPTANPPLTNARAITVQVSTLSADATQIAFGEGALACADAPYEPLATDFLLPLNRSFTLAPGLDGTRDIRVCAKDEAGNVTGAQGVLRQITLDVTPPQVTVNIAGGAAFATSTAVNVNLAATPAGDLLKFVLSPDPAVDCNTVTFPGGAFAVLPATTGATLSSGDGERFVVACLRDRAGNIARFSDTITLDTTSPTATFALNQGAAFTTSTTVTTNFTNVSGDVIEFARANGALNCATTSYTAFVNGTNFTLSGGDGERLVSVCLRDAAGNTALFTDTIRLDQTNPSVAFTVARRGTPSPGAGFTNIPEVVLTFSAIASDSVAIAVANTGIDCATVSYEALPSPLPSGPFAREFTLAGGADGQRVVAVCVRDAAGRTNGTSGTTATINLDVAPPTVSSFVINDGDAVTNDRDISVSMTSIPSNDLVRFFIREGATPICPATAFSGGFSELPVTTALTLEEGQDGARRVFGCFQDLAGNVGVVLAEIVLDTTFPFPAAAECVNCNQVGPVAFTRFNQIFVEPIALAPDVALAVTVLSNTVNQTDRSCTRNEDCRTAEVCGLFPDAFQGNTLLQRCIEEHPNINAIEINLAVQSEPLAGVPSEGAQTFAIAYIDAAGNISPQARTTVVRDVTTPTVAYALSPTVTNDSVTFIRDLTLTGETIVPEAEIAGTYQASALATFSDVSPLGFPAITPPILTDAIPVTLTPGDGAKTVFVRFVDNAGNVASVVQRSITVDTQPPSQPLFSALASDIVNTTTVSVASLLLQSTDTVGLRAVQPYDLIIPAVVNSSAVCPTGTALSAGRVCTWNGTTTVAVPLLVGDNVIRVRAVDTASNVSAEDIIIVERDNTAPTVSAVTIVDTGGITTQPAITVQITASDIGSGLADMQIAVDGTADTEPFIAFSNVTTAVLLGPDGPKTVAVRVRDRAGNISTPGTDTTTLDQTPPTPPSLIVAAPSPDDPINHQCARFGVDLNPIEGVATVLARINNGPLVACSAVTANPTLPVPEDACFLRTNVTPNQLTFALAQDQTNVVEVVSVDVAGNRSDSSFARFDEQSSTQVPTNLAVKAVCGGGTADAFAILKDDQTWPIVQPQGGTTGRVQLLGLPELKLLNLASGELFPLSGPTGRAAQAGQFNGLAGLSEGRLIDAACAPNSRRLVLLYQVPVTGQDGPLRVVIQPEPFLNPNLLTPSSADIRIGGGDGIAIASLDALRFASPDSGALDFTAAVTSINAGSGISRTEAIRGISVVAASAATAPTVTLGAVRSAETVNYSTNIRRVIFGLAADANTIAWVERELNTWFVRQQNGVSITTLKTISGTAFPVARPPWYQIASPSTLDPASRYLLLGEDDDPTSGTDVTNDGLAVSFDMPVTATTFVSGNRINSSSPISPAAPIFDRGAFPSRNLGFLNPSDRLTWSFNNTFGNNTTVYAAVVDATKPIIGVSTVAGGNNAIVVFHADGFFSGGGVVVGRSNISGCFE